MYRKTVLAVAVVLALFAAQLCRADSKAGEPTPEETISRKSAELAKSGAPSPRVVAAAFQRAQTQPTVESWRAAADVANEYANAVDTLSDSYARQYNASVSSESRYGERQLLQKSADYETTRNIYLAKRNEAYVQIAMILLAKGDRSGALAYATTAVELSGTQACPKAEDLVKKIIEYQQEKEPKATR